MSKRKKTRDIPWTELYTKEQLEEMLNSLTLEGLQQLERALPFIERRARLN